MHPAPPAVLELALQLRFLRREHWPDSNLTQAALARALGQDVPVSSATVASWESRTGPKLPPRERVTAYAQFFATRRSLGPPPALVPLDSFTPEEQAAHQALREELLQLHTAARGGTVAEEPIVARRSWHFADSGPLTLVCTKLPEERGTKTRRTRPTRTTRN